MGKHIVGFKGRRVLRLVLGMNYKPITTLLRAHGLDDAALREGWELLYRSSFARTDKAAVDLEPQVLASIAAFQSAWFKATRFVLERSFPAIGKEFFRNLTHQTGQEGALALNVFLGRLAELAEPAGRFGADGPQARALLSVRGLTAAVEAEGRGWLDALAQARVVEEPLNAVNQAAADAAAWAYFLEWRAITRIAVKNKTYLRRLGLSKARAVQEEGAEEGEEEDEDDVVVAGVGAAAPRLELTGTTPVPALGAGAGASAAE